MGKKEPVAPAVNPITAQAAERATDQIRAARMLLDGDLLSSAEASAPLLLAIAQIIATNELTVATQQAK